MEKTRVVVGQKYRVELPYSEVCLSMRVAGKVGEIELIPRYFSDSDGNENCYYVAQIFFNGEPWSAPILDGEAGFYHDAKGYYAYTV
jgi:hypothetical protein